MDGARLAQVDLFSNFTAEERQRLAECMTMESHGRGTVLVEEGDLPTKFFVIVDGRVTVHRDGHHLADLGPGDYFGEVGVISLEPRNASVIATTPVEVAVTMGWELREVLSDSPDLRTTLESAARNRGSH
ncbi:MAG TPA: cyclic nucleotide-binding domain-containing protein [Acidimicrobiia bacterium]|nr:cyclic nucleotide-binding domain-containing protein [Acidimicrobiia bacterium]